MSNFKIDFGGKKKKQMFPEQKQKIEYGEVPNIENDTELELTELQKSFREKAKKEADLKKKNTGTEFWSCVVFETQEQRDRFFEILGIKEKDNQYINGKKLIKALELKIETLESGAPGKFKCNKEIVELSIKPI